MAVDLKLAQPMEFYRKFLSADARPDGRELGEFRATTLKLRPVESTADGSALVKIGATSVICGVKVELFEPQPDDSPDQGRLVPNLELNAGCSPSFKSGPPSELAQVLSQTLSDVLTASAFVDPRALCLAPGRLAFCLFVDVVCLDFDGNVFDATLAAAVAALCVTSLPVVKFDAETKAISVSREERVPLAVDLNRIPSSTTFSVFEDGILLVDANREEEELAMDGQMSVVTTADRVLLLHKPGGAAIPQPKIQTCVDRAFQRTKFVRRTLDEAMSADSASQTR